MLTRYRVKACHPPVEDGQTINPPHHNLNCHTPPFFVEIGRAIGYVHPSTIQPPPDEDALW
jgi:hypothetical protein